MKSVISQEDGRMLETMAFAWKAVKHAKSNAVVLAAADGKGAFFTVGIGSGQTWRVKATRDALEVAGNRTGQSVVCASDAFFPFRDSVDELAKKGVRYVVQTGGSMRDDETVAAANEHGVNMWFTGYRVFKH